MDFVLKRMNFALKNDELNANVKDDPQFKGTTSEGKLAFYYVRVLCRNEDSAMVIEDSCLEI